VAIDFYIAGVLKYPVPGSISVTTRLNQPSTCDFIINSDDNTYSPATGEEVKVYEGGTQLFGGLVVAVAAERFTPSGLRQSRVTATDYTALPGRRTTGDKTGTSAYTNAKAGDIMRDLVTTCMAGDGIDLSDVAAGSGPTIERAEFSYATVEDAFNWVAGVAKYVWRIAPDKKLKFYSPTAPASSATFGDATGNHRPGTSVRRTMEQYANRITVVFGRYIQGGQREKFDSGHGTQPTDGSRTTWDLAYPLAATPTVVINDTTARTVGIQDVDTGKDWYYQIGSSQIRQDSGGVVLTASDSITISYEGYTTAVVTKNDTAEQTARAAAESTSGIYERIYNIDDPTTQSNAEDVAQAILDTVSEESFVAELETDSVAVTVGDKITMSVTGYQTGDYIVRAVSMIDIPAASGAFFRRRVEAHKGPILEDGVQAFGGLAGGGESVSGGASMAAGGVTWPLIGNGAGSFINLYNSLGQARLIVAVDATKGGYIYGYKGTVGELSWALNRANTSRGAHLRLYDAQANPNEKYIGFRAPDDVVNDYEVIMPDDLPGSTKALVVSSTGQASWQATGSASWYTITYGATITPNLNNGGAQKCTLTGNVIVAAPTNGADGQTLKVQLIQDGTGNRTVTWNAVFKFAPGADVIHPDAGKVTLWEFVLDGSSWLCLSASFGL